MNLEVCEGCECALGDDDVEVETQAIPAQMQFEKAVRDYVLDQLDRDGDSTFIQKVEICPGSVEVAYTDKS